MHGRAVHVSGVAGAGKSTLCRGLVDAEPGWIHAEADRCLPQAHASVYVDEQAIGDLVLAFHESIAAYTARGLVVLVDGSLPAGPESLRHKCLDALAVASRGILVRVEVQIDREAWTRRNPDASPDDHDWFGRQLSMSEARSEQFDLVVDAEHWEIPQVVADLKVLLTR